MLAHGALRPNGSRAIPRYNSTVSRFYSLDDANALVPDLAIVTGRLREQRDELVGLRDAYRDREGVVAGLAAEDDDDARAMSEWIRQSLAEKTS